MRTPCIFQFKRSRLKYDPNMSRKWELSTFVTWHKYLWNFMLHNPPCSYIMLFLKNTEAEENLWEGSQMKNNLLTEGVQSTPHAFLTSAAWQFWHKREATMECRCLFPPVTRWPSIWFSINSDLF